MFTFEDFTDGQQIVLGPYLVSEQEIIEFATEFDPQPFHLSEEAGRSTSAGGLIASGWHTCSILMRMMCDAYIDKSSFQGAPGVKHIKWLNPVRPGDVLSGTTLIQSKRQSRSRPSLGLVELKHQLVNQRGEIVLEVENTGIMGLRNPQQAGVAK